MAITASGVKGMRRPSYKEGFNLAREIRNGDRIHVPRFEEVLPTPTPYGLSADGRIDINLADAVLLETLPGIGPALAQRIIEYREMNGPFETVDEIQEVSGIGPAKYDGIKELITAGEPP